MFVLNDDMSIYATRGDTVFFTVCATDGSGAKYKFKPDDVVRFKAFEKKACENVVAQKDFVITEETEEVNILLTEDDTRFGKTISKPRDYWYEIELNPFTNPQTIIGYDDDGPKVFRLYPESKNIVKDISEEDFYADAELSMTSTNPVQNQAVTRAVANLTKYVDDELKGVVDSVLSGEEALRIRGELRRLDAEVTQQKSDLTKETTERKAEIAVERERINQFTSLPEGSTSGDAELTDARVDYEGNTHDNVGEHIRNVSLRFSKEIWDTNDLLSADYVKTSNNYIDSGIYKQTLVSDNFYDSYHNNVILEFPKKSILTSGYYVFGVVFTDGTKATNVDCSVDLLAKDGTKIKNINASVGYSAIEINEDNPATKARVIFGGTSRADYANKTIEYFYLIHYGTTPDDYSEVLQSYLQQQCEENTKILNGWYSGKFQSFLGDSNTDNGLYIPYVVNALKLKGYAKCGVGGSNIAGGGADAFHTDYRINTLDLSSDIVSIMGGTNDSANNRNIGDISLENHDTSTLVGGLNVTISKIYYKFLKGNGFYPDIDYSGITQVDNAKDIILWIYTPPFSTNETYINNGKLKEVVDTIIKVADMWGIPVADIYHKSLINMANGSLYMGDGVHFNDAGAKKVGSVIVGTMKNLSPVV